MTVKSEIIQPRWRSRPGITPNATAQWFFSPAVVQATTSIAMAADRVYYQPMLYSGMPIDRIGIDVTTGAAGLCRLGIYTNEDGQPGTLILDAGTVDTTNIATVEATITTLYLPNAWVWVCAVFNATPTVRIGGTGDASVVGSTGFGSATRGANAVLTFGALPATASLQSFNRLANCVMIGVRKSA